MLSRGARNIEGPGMCDPFRCGLNTSATLLLLARSYLANTTSLLRYYDYSTDSDYLSSSNFLSRRLNAGCECTADCKNVILFNMLGVLKVKFA